MLGLLLAVGALLSGLATLFPHSAQKQTAWICLGMIALASVFLVSGVVRLCRRHVHPKRAQVLANSIEKYLENSQPRLLHKSEPAYRVFFGNLFEFVFRPSFLVPSYKPQARGIWSDVFVSSRKPWPSLLQSMLWHTVGVVAIWSLSQGSRVIVQPPLLARYSQSHLTYKAPTFPAARSRPVRLAEQRLPAKDSRRQLAYSVAREFRQKQVSAPQVKMAGTSLPASVLSKPVVPAVPLGATRSSRLPISASLMTPVAPAPDTAGASLGRGGLASASIVPPPPSIGMVSGRGTSLTSSEGIVPPPPSVEGAIRTPGGINIGPSDVVQPAPNLPVHEQGTTSGVSRAGLGDALITVIPPPPSVSRSGTLRRGGGTALASTDVQIVPPPVSITGVGVGRGNGRSRGGSPSFGTAQAVPPPVSGRDIPLSSGNRGSAALANSFVPVPNSDSSLTASVSGGEGGEGKSGGGSSLPSGNARGASPSPNGQPGDNSLSGNASGTGSAAAMDVHPPAMPPPTKEYVDENASGITRDLPMRLVAMAQALPTSSYFANYEVFIAERQVGQGVSELIKLVYESLPYQRRLSEYGLNSAKIYKVRVTRDASCDESLLDMTFPENHDNSTRNSSSDKNQMLPCYRTTADDYRKAMARSAGGSSKARR